MSLFQRSSLAFLHKTVSVVLPICQNPFHAVKLSLIRPACPNQTSRLVHVRTGHVRSGLCTMFGDHPSDGGSNCPGQSVSTLSGNETDSPPDNPVVPSA